MCWFSQLHVNFYYEYLAEYEDIDHMTRKPPSHREEMIGLTREQESIH